MGPEIMIIFMVVPALLLFMVEQCYLIMTQSIILYCIYLYIYIQKEITMLHRIMMMHLPKFTTSSNMGVRVRYAPSPTGPMHLGAVRTALFNYLYAKHNHGKFIVRIEDTDLERNVHNGANHILDTLAWLGIDPDESIRVGGQYQPYVQSKRLHIYKQIQNQLLKKGYAYPCFCSSSNNTKKTTKKQSSKQQPTSIGQGYDGKCRQLTPAQAQKRIAQGQKYTIRIKSDVLQQIPSFIDQLHGNVVATPFDDFIIVKNNGYPTFHFANVIDDWKMGITHVIRGMEWLTNTSKHIYLYRLFGVQPPKFVHLPLIFTADGKKLSKRDPTAPIVNLQQKGYLPEAIINYVGLMGFNPKPQQQSTDSKTATNQNQQQQLQQTSQFFTLPQLISAFKLCSLKPSPTKSDHKKLNFFNRYYMRKKWKDNDPQFVQQVLNKLRHKHNLNTQSVEYSEKFLREVVDTVLERVSNVDEILEYDYFFNRPDLSSEIAVKDIKKILGTKTQIIKSAQYSQVSIINSDPASLDKCLKILHNLRLIWVHILPPNEHTEQKISQTISKFIYDNKDSVQNEDAYHLLRLAVTGRKSGVNIVRTCRILGQQRVSDDLARLHDLLTRAKGNNSGSSISNEAPVSKV